MSRLLKWTDYETLGAELYARYPDVDPLTTNLAMLHRWVCDIPSFADSPEASSEANLDAILAAWANEYQDVQ